jgi:hypothetical protein
MSKNHLSISSYRTPGSFYKRISTKPPPKDFEQNSMTPHEDAIKRGEFSIFPRNIYDKEPVHIPKYQRSQIWNLEWNPNETPSYQGGYVFDFRKGGQLPPYGGRYVPPNSSLGPWGPQPGLSYVKCGPEGPATMDPPNMAPPRYYH